MSCAVIDAKTPAAERTQTVEDYRNLKIDVLVNVDIFSEGYDCPEVEFIQLARPTLSLCKYLQQVGRGMRISEGKEAVLILDNVGLYQTFGLPTEERDWQQTFYGKISGKGLHGLAHPVVIKEGLQDEKILVNLEMVHIRRRSESLEGLNIYLQDGRYGIMKDGEITTQPVFERIEKLHDGLFYAIGIYPWEIYHSCKTVIDLNGKDLGVKLYGNIDVRGEFLYGTDIKGERMVWDAVGKRYYHGREPLFERIAGLDLIKVSDVKYELRYSGGPQLFRFCKEEILFNKFIVVIRDLLIVKNESFRTFRIFDYMDDKILTYGKMPYNVIPVFWNGHIGKPRHVTINDLSSYPNLEKLQLRRVE